MSETKEFITDKHGENLPTVRIKKAILKNFKNVEYGEITFNCGRQFVPCNTESDILGIYGQNGSGKTAFIEALTILKGLMSGYQLRDKIVDCIAIGKESSELEFVFDLQYSDNKTREATYAFSLASREATDEEIKEKHKNTSEDSPSPEKEKRVVVFNEKFFLDWEDSSKKQRIIDTSSKDSPFFPSSKRKELMGGKGKDLAVLGVNKNYAYKDSRSFIFMPETLSIFKEYNEECIFYEVLAELRLFAQYYLFVLSTRSSGLIRLNFALPIFCKEGEIPFFSNQTCSIDKEDFEDINNKVKNISLVLEQLVPGLTIGIKKFSETLTENGEKADNVMLVAYRDGKEFPLRNESDGVRRTISILSLIIEAFNQKSTTVAIDEFDAGIFEYLLGEILQAMEESGKGQFIFTSHNLRPLEVINRKFLYFTTTNPQNRYYRLRNIAATNNLRDTYFREIILNEQKEELYNRTKRFKIVAALRKAGEGIE